MLHTNGCSSTSLRDWSSSSLMYSSSSLSIDVSSYYITKCLHGIFLLFMFVLYCERELVSNQILFLEKKKDNRCKQVNSCYHVRVNDLRLITSTEEYCIYIIAVALQKFLSHWVQKYYIQEFSVGLNRLKWQMTFSFSCRSWLPLWCPSGSVISSRIPITWLWWSSNVFHTLKLNLLLTATTRSKFSWIVLLQPIA